MTHIHEPGGIVIVPARLAGRLAVALDTTGQTWRNDPELVELVRRFAFAGLTYRGHRTADLGTPRDQAPEQRAGSPQRLSTTQAACRLGVTDRAVRLAIARERLPAEAIGGRWVLDPADVDSYGRRRQGRAA